MNLVFHISEDGSEIVLKTFLKMTFKQRLRNLHPPGFTPWTILLTEVKFRQSLNTV